MTLAKLKKELAQMTHKQVVDLALDMYAKVPAAKDFLGMFVSLDIEKLAEKYKNQIRRDLKVKFDGSPRDVSARKLIRDVRKMGIDELSVELELFYAECAYVNMEEWGYWETYSYSNAMQKMFYDAREKIEKNGWQEKYNGRLNALREKGRQYGYLY
jgi:hypothetical protein